MNYTHLTLLQLYIYFQVSHLMFVCYFAILNENNIFQYQHPKRSNSQFIQAVWKVSRTFAGIRVNSPSDFIFLPGFFCQLVVGIFRKLNVSYLTIELVLFHYNQCLVHKRYTKQIYIGFTTIASYFDVLDYSTEN